MSKAIEDALAIELDALQAFRKPADIIREINSAKAHWLAFERQARAIHERAVLREAREVDNPSKPAVGHLKRNQPKKARA
jgi:hypothetical protein